MTQIFRSPLVAAACAVCAACALALIPTASHAQTSTEAMGAAGLASAGAPSQTLRVCLVDTGSAPDAGAVRRDAVDGGDPGDVSGAVSHGSNGVRLMRTLWPHAEVFSVRVMFPDGSIPYAQVAAGIRRCLSDPSVAAISVPLSGDAPADSSAGAIAMREAVDSATGRAVAVFAGTGNSGGAVGYPARMPGVVAVGGVLHEAVCQSDIVPAFGPEVQLTAPVCELDAGEDFVEGTSYTTSATAVAFTALRAYSGADAATVLAAMKQTAGPSLVVNVSGAAAALNIAALTAAARSRDTSPVPFSRLTVNRRLPRPRVKACRVRAGIKVTRLNSLRGGQLSVTVGRAQFRATSRRQFVIPASARRLTVRFVRDRSARSSAARVPVRVCAQAR
jgi:hypothetical protein